MATSEDKKAIINRALSMNEAYMHKMDEQIAKLDTAIETNREKQVGGVEEPLASIHSSIAYFRRGSLN